MRMQFCSSDLVFFFVDELLPDQMPETVHLMPQGNNFLQLESIAHSFLFLLIEVSWQFFNSPQHAFSSIIRFI